MAKFLTEAERMRIISGMKLTDNLFFTKCFSENPECVDLMLRIILGRDDLKVMRASVQKWVVNLGRHSAILDILAEDSNGDVYDIEIQNDESEAEPKRARYYSSSIDTSLLGSGEDYRRLPESYMIFLTDKDPIGKGKDLYRIDRMVAEPLMSFGDGSHIIYANAENAGSDTALGKLMADLMCAEPCKMHYTEIRNAVRKYKETKEGIAVMTGEFERALERAREIGAKEARAKALEEGRIEGINEGRLEGINEGRMEERKKNAQSMILDGILPLDKVAEYSGLSIEEVECLKEKAAEYK